MTCEPSYYQGRNRNIFQGVPKTLFLIFPSVILAFFQQKFPFWQTQKSFQWFPKTEKQKKPFSSYIFLFFFFSFSSFTFPFSLVFFYIFHFFPSLVFSQLISQQKFASPAPSCLCHWFHWFMQFSEKSEHVLIVNPCRTLKVNSIYLKNATICQKYVAYAFIKSQCKVSRFLHLMHAQWMCLAALLTHAICNAVIFWSRN